MSTRLATLQHLAAFDLGNRAVSNGATTERVFTVLAVDDPLPAMGQPPHLGRGFSAEELAPGGPMVAVISHRLWSTMFGADPDILGRSIRVNGLGRTVVGVTASGSTLLNQLFLLLRTTTDPGSALPAVRRTLAAMDPDLPLYLIQTMEQTLAGSVAPQRISLSLMGGFAVAALVIACIVYGVVAYWVALRSREMAIRMALGASAQQVTRLVAGETMRLVTTGAVLGVGGAIGLAGLARSQLYETSATDPLALAGAGLVLVLIGLAAGVLPSRRASRVSPVDLLRAE